jgi:non-specific serine/threonine protein kinase
MATPGPPERYHFGAFDLQPDKRRLLKDGATISLRPRAFDLLAALVDRAGHLLTKDELLDQVWPKMVVEEAALHVQVSALRKVLGADAITTVSGRGYQFTLPVTTGDGEANRASKPKHNLPYQLTSFIGREQEIAQLVELVTANRLVTLTGAGGAGKTRLALEVAAQVVESCPDGVWLVELASLSDASLVLQTLARALGLTEQPGKRLIDTIADHLASKRLLLMLDNAEHLLDACVQLVDRILRCSSSVVMLVTSRQRLGLAGERTYRVPSLTVPDRTEQLAPERISSYEGVRLFVERAQLLRRDFEVTSSNATAVASICYRLDGIPLAIELAAPRLVSMSVKELNQRLDERFALLTGGSRAALPRHRTLRSLIDWSYDLLTSSEQAMLSRVSVFAGGWTLATAEQVCTGNGIEAPEVIDLLASLADKNLVLADEKQGKTRYRMLETVRQYAKDRLRESGEEAQWRNRHLASFLGLAEEAFPEVRGPSPQVWLDRLAAEHDNLRAALGWSAATSQEQGLQLAASLYRYWFIRGHLTEGREWYARLLEALPSDTALVDRARALNNAGILARVQGDHAAAQTLLQESLAIGRELNAPKRITAALGNLAIVAMEQARYEDAEALLQETAMLERAIGDRLALAGTLENLGVLLRVRGDYPAARLLLEESLTTMRDIGERLGEAVLLRSLGLVECAQGNLKAAERHLREALTICQEISDRVDAADAIEGLALVAVAMDAPRQATRIWGAAERLREELGSPMPPYEQAAYVRAMAHARATFGDEAFDQAWREGREMRFEDAMKYALGDDAGRPD